MKQPGKIVITDNKVKFEYYKLEKPNIESHWYRKKGILTLRVGKYEADYKKYKASKRIIEVSNKWWDTSRKYWIYNTSIGSGFVSH